ncbi:hypothetical protein [Mycolicibacterium sp. YH-1]|uniref:hypothetical protein n=1 Tax=Mycolicibacterium sp. YH-1 TaxID=2908837 RepID=UPI001F4C3E9C|nr:hypothetical protein [Mycolicibacterium sp. YH-1]UNB52394.1 hypothetical protein L0M16_31875 [Mycolicibacterium sp. YH-1]
MTTSTISRTLLATLAAALLTAGCGGSAQDATSSTPTSPGASPSSTAAPELTDQQEPPAVASLDVTIRGGEVIPANTQMDAEVGQPIVIRVNSDAAYELHVHSSPEHSFAIAPTNGQSFQFTVDVPGRVDVELHQLHTTIVTITVVQ